MHQKPIIAVFDFDDTLIHGDSLIDFVRFAFPTHVVLISGLRVLPAVLYMKFGHMTNAEAKETLLTTFFGSMPDKQFLKLCDDYTERLDALMRQEAMDRVAWHQKQGHRVIIISASAEDWINPWARKHGMPTVIATKLERQHGSLTGKLRGKNCFDKEKAVRFLEAFPERNTYELYVYGDGKSDMAMFDLADHVFKRRFT